MDKFYLLASEDVQDNQVAIFEQKDESSEKKWKSKVSKDSESFLEITHPFIIKKIVSGFDILKDDLSIFIDENDSEWINFYSKDVWEIIFWLLGYDVYNKENEFIIQKIKLSSKKEILFYIQCVVNLREYYSTGCFFERFRYLCVKYLKTINEKEKNKVFLELINELMEDWIII